MNLNVNLSQILILFFITVQPVLGDHCHERPPVLEDHYFLAEGPTIQM